MGESSCLRLISEHKLTQNCFLQFLVQNYKMCLLNSKSICQRKELNLGISSTKEVKRSHFTLFPSSLSVFSLIYRRVFICFYIRQTFFRLVMQPELLLKTLILTCSGSLEILFRISRILSF